MQLTGNEILLAQFSKAGYIRMDDLLTYLSTELGGGGGSSNSPSGIEFTLDTNTYPNNKFWIRTTVLPESYVTNSLHAVLLNADGAATINHANPVGVIDIGFVAEGTPEEFNVLFIADGYSKLAFVKITNTGGVYSVQVSENPFIAV